MFGESPENIAFCIMFLNAVFLVILGLIFPQKIEAVPYVVLLRNTRNAIRSIAMKTPRIGVVLAVLTVLSVVRADQVISPSEPNIVVLPPVTAKFVKLVIHSSSSGGPCIDEFEIYGPDEKKNLALSANGGKAGASSCLPNYAIHQILHLNDGLYGNDHSWIGVSEENEWAQIELPEPSQVARIVFTRDRTGKLRDRVPASVTVMVSGDGKQWQTAVRVNVSDFAADVKAGNRDEMIRGAFLHEKNTWERMNGGDHLSPLKVDRPAIPGGQPYWSRLARMDSL